MRVVKALIFREHMEVKDMVIDDNGNISDLAENLSVNANGFLTPEGLSVDAYYENFGKPNLVEILQEKGEY